MNGRNQMLTATTTPPVHRDTANTPTLLRDSTATPVLRDNNVSLSDSFLSTHTPSPDEAVIQARGRRQV